MVGGMPLQTLIERVAPRVEGQVIYLDIAMAADSAAYQAWFQQQLAVGSSQAQLAAEATSSARTITLPADVVEQLVEAYLSIERQGLVRLIKGEV